MSQSSSYPCHPCHPWLRIFARMFNSDVLQCKAVEGHLCVPCVLLRPDPVPSETRLAGQSRSCFHVVPPIRRQPVEPRAVRNLGTADEYSSLSAPSAKSAVDPLSSVATAPDWVFRGFELPCSGHNAGSPIPMT